MGLPMPLALFCNCCTVLTNCLDLAIHCHSISLVPLLILSPRRSPTARPGLAFMVIPASQQPPAQATLAVLLDPLAKPAAQLCLDSSVSQELQPSCALQATFVRVVRSVSCVLHEARRQQGPSTGKSAKCCQATMEGQIPFTKATLVLLSD